MRRHTGIGAVRKQKLEQERYKDKGSEIQENQFEQMTKQLEVFRTNLEEFAAKHKNDIKKDSTFRRQFQEMCASIGVDPLASGKGFWSVLNLGDFYYELSIQIVEVCLATSEKNGGIIGLEEVRERLVKARGRSQEHQDITQDDLLCAAKKLRVLGNGFSVVPVGRGRYIVQSIPGELSMDQTAVLTQAANDGGSVSVDRLRSALGWDDHRAQKALDTMIQEGLAWIDTQNEEGGPLYWFPSFFSACVSS